MFNPQARIAPASGLAPWGGKASVGTLMSLGFVYILDRHLQGEQETKHTPFSLLLLTYEPFEWQIAELWDMMTLWCHARIGDFV